MLLDASFSAVYLYNDGLFFFLCFSIVLCIIIYAMLFVSMHCFALLTQYVHFNHCFVSHTVLFNQLVCLFFLFRLFCLRKDYVFSGEIVIKNDLCNDHYFSHPNRLREVAAISDHIR